MSDLFEVRLEDIVIELNREIMMRRKVYPRLIARGELSPELAERRIALLEAGVDRLQGIEP